MVAPLGGPQLARLQVLVFVVVLSLVTASLQDEDSTYGIKMRTQIEPAQVITQAVLDQHLLGV